MDMFQGRSMLIATVVILYAIAALDVSPARGQEEQSKVSTSDAIFPYPVVQGEPGKRDPTAMAEIEECERISGLPSKTSLNINGNLFSGAENGSSGSQVSLVMEDGKLRMDSRDADGQERGIRMIGRSARIIGAPPTARPVSISEFGDPLMLPINLKSITTSSNAAIVDDGMVNIGERRMHKVTVTFFPIRGANATGRSPQSEQAASLYFDPNTHLLLKSAVLNHSLTDADLQYLQVTSYERYKQVESIMTPSRYVQTVNGQKLMVLDATGISLSSTHGDADFK